ncbi:MAG: PQQ-binding-like beta-propeller repeat protein [Candidatus Sumerlaeaceae bacterium]
MPVSALTETANPPVGVAAKPAGSSTGARNFSFIHMSDIHVDTWTTMPLDLSAARSFKCVSMLKDLDRVELRPYTVTAPRPSFFIATGDNTEFGFAGVTGDVLNRYFHGVKQPVFFATGNHDNTWVPPTKWFKERYGGENYSFDFGGCHFIALNSCTLHDPNPSFGEETIGFIRNDLRTRDNSTPIFCFCHHPLHGGEFASKYDGDRVLDALRTHNAVLFLVGHGHSSVTFDFAGIPGVMGGSTFTNGKQPTEGYNIVSVDGDKLRVAYRRMIDPSASKPMLERTIPKRANYPSILTQAGLVQVDGCRKLQISASIGGMAAPLASATYELDDETSGRLNVSGATASASLYTTDVLNGSHFVRFTFSDQQGNSYQRSAPVYLDLPGGSGTATAKWRRQLGGSSRSTPLVHEGGLYIGANDGKFYAFDAATGNPLWTFNAGCEIACGAAYFNGSILFGSGDGKFRALTLDGKEKWRYDGKLPVFSSPVVDAQGVVYFGSNDGVLTALDAATGRVRWRNTDAQYSIESKPLLHEGRLYVGAWDGYIYCVNCADGRTQWRKPGTHNQKRVVRYYAPADATPVIANRKLFVSDRGYYGGVYNLDGVFEGKIADDVTAFGTSADGRSLYLRNTKSGLSKIDTQTTTIWESQLVAGRVPSAPIEQAGRVFVITNRGDLNVLDAGTGMVQCRYRVTPRLYVMGSPAVDGNTVYACGQDGVLTAIAVPR